MTWRTNAFYIFNRPAETILEYPFGAGLTRKPVVERELETFLSGVINVCESDEVASDFAGRVVAPVFALHVYAGQIQC